MTNGITGNATAYSKATASGGSGIAKATGIKDLYVYVADATGVGYAKAGTGTIGKITSNVSATVNAANNAYVYTYGLDDVTLSAGVAQANNAKGDLAFGGAGTVGSIYQKQTATATAGKPYGTAKATAEPIIGLDIYVGNAYGNAAYAGKGYVAQGGSVKGVAGAYATGYNTTATALGLSDIKVSAGNAGGADYATGGTGYIGQFIGTATANATSIKSYGSVNSKAIAYGINGILAYAGNAQILNSRGHRAGHRRQGHHGRLPWHRYRNCLLKEPLQRHFHFARAEGIADVYAYAGNATNYGNGPAKTFYGKIGAAGAIVGTATANATTKGGGSAVADAYAYGIEFMSLNAANAVTYNGGPAIAKNAYAFIAGVKGYGTATSYAYGKSDPSAKSIGVGMVYFTMRAGSAFVELGGTGAAYAAGGDGGTGQAIVQGIIAKGSAYATAKGTASAATPVNAYAASAGMEHGTRHHGTPDTYAHVQAADGYSSGNAYGGKGYVGEVYGPQRLFDHDGHGHGDQRLPGSGHRDPPRKPALGLIIYATKVSAGSRLLL